MSADLWRHDPDRLPMPTASLLNEQGPWSARIVRLSCRLRRFRLLGHVVAGNYRRAGSSQSKLCDIGHVGITVFLYTVRQTSKMQGRKRRRVKKEKERKLRDLQS